MNSFVVEINMDREQILFLFDLVYKYYIYFLFGGLVLYFMINILDVLKVIRIQVQYVFLGMRVMDQLVLLKLYNLKEFYLKLDMIYIYDRR